MPSLPETWTAVFSPRLREVFSRSAAAIRARGGTPLLPPIELPPIEPPPPRNAAGPSIVVWIEAEEDQADPSRRPILRLTDEPLPIDAGWDERRLPRDGAAELVAETAELLAWAARLDLERAAWKIEARTDGLTGLLNRRGWEAAEAELARLGGFGTGLALFDLDDFRSVNERFSHAAGDACLRGFGRLLQETAARGGEGCRGVRLGGDEFALWAVGASREETAALAERAASAWNTEASEGRSADAKTTVSAGWFWSAAPFATASAEAFQAADQALLAAKRAGKARVVAAT